MFEHIEQSQTAFPRGGWGLLATLLSLLFGA